MAQSKSLLFRANGREFPIFLKKYNDEHISPTDFHSDEIREEKLLLTSKQTFSNFKSLQRKLHQANRHPSLGFPAWLDHASNREFGEPYQKLLGERKEALRKRYQVARASKDRTFLVSELEACAGQGHVQAVLDLGLLHEAESNSRCIGYFSEAHSLGHPDGLLFLSRPFFRSHDYEQAIRALLAGAWCGNIRCSQLLIQMLTKMQQVFVDPRCRAALEESCGYGSLLAKYLLGYLLRHGDERYRDEDRGCSLLKEAEKTKHYRADNGRGPFVFVDGVAKPVAGTLANIEALIDLQMNDIRQKELSPKFDSLMAEYMKKPRCATAGGDEDELFFDILREINPWSERVVRRLAAWLEGDDNEPPDEAKLVRMNALFIETDKKASKGADNE